MKIYIVTDTEAGWDCVCGVYNNFREAYEAYGGTLPGGYKDLDCEEIEPYMVHEKELKITEVKNDNPYNIDYKRQTKLDL